MGRPRAARAASCCPLKTGGVATVTIPAPGVHTLNVWAREDGLRIDRILLTTDPNLSPEGLGPAESSRMGEATETPSPTQTADRARRAADFDTRARTHRDRDG